MNRSDLLEQLPIAAAHINEYFGPWAILEDPFRTAVARVRDLDLLMHVESRAADPKAGQPAANAYARTPGQAESDGQVAVIRLQGPLMKQLSSVGGGTSTVAARAQVRHATADKGIDAILMLFDTPGGTVAGTQSLGDDVARAAATKPTWAYADDLCASAGYWVASQCHKIFANPTAQLGGIGTYGKIEDSSAVAAKEGRDVIIVRAGQFKGSGEPGTKVTPEEIAELQERIDAMNEHFLAAVAAGRHLPIAQVRELADGHVWVGAAAIQSKIIDGVQSLDETLLQLTNSIPQSRGLKAMSTDQTPPAAADKPPVLEVAELKSSDATLADLQAAMPRADNDFLIAQLEAHATIDQAKNAWMAEQDKRLAAKDQELDNAKAAAAKPGVAALGGAGGSTSTESFDDPAAEFNSRVAEKVKAGMNKMRATSQVAQDDPDLHAAYITTYNAAHGRPGR